MKEDHDCTRWCKVHRYYDFHSQFHRPYPADCFVMHPVTKKWREVTVYIGPPAYYPKRPTNDQVTNMAAHCPHVQADLTCNNCLRHVFHPYQF